MPYHSVRSRISLLTGVLSLIWLLLPVTASAQSPVAAQNTLQPKWNDAVANLVAKIAGLANPSQPATLTFANISSLDALDVSAIEQAFESDLSKHLRLVPRGVAPTQITITFSEGAASYVWVAQVSTSASQQIAMVATPKARAAAVRGERPAISLQRKLIWSQPKPFLDFSLPDGVPANGPSLIVLEPSSVDFYKSINGQWAAGKSVGLNVAIAPRSARGEIWQSGEEIDMFVPGASCSGVVGTLPELVCAGHPSTNPAVNWPLVTGETQRQDAQFESNRNFFAGLVSVNGVDASIPPFYTAAPKATADGLDWLIASVDGKAQIYDGSKKLIATFSGWGDQVATIDTGCGDSWQALVTGTGDSAQPDHIQLYDIRNYSQISPQSASAAGTASPQAVVAGQPLDFSGPVLALWSSGDLKSARVVSLNLQTGIYEGSIISVSCGQ